MTEQSVPNRSLVIPAYNEENRITHFIDSIHAFDGELIVVCDGTDRTADHRLGKGGGVLAGLREARAPLVGFVDADGSTGIGEMLRLFSFLQASDGAIGSRWVDGSDMKVKQGILRQAESRCFNLLIRILFGLSFHDTQCGAKVFTRAAIDAVLPSMTSRGFEFDVELLWRHRLLPL